MSRVITFSERFPPYHPRKGEATRFAEKILMGLPGADTDLNLDISMFLGWTPKHHTIRSGHHWKEGDWFSPRVWGNNINPKSGRKGPYHSKQIIIAPDIQIKKVWNFEKHPSFTTGMAINGKIVTDQMLIKCSQNDGLDLDDFEAWFNKTHFNGQIICWSADVEY